MTYKEWFNSIVDTPEYLGTDLAKAAWNHQQKRIDELEAFRDEAVKVIEHYGYPDIGMEGRAIYKSGCVSEDFQNSEIYKKVVEGERGGKRARAWLEENKDD